MDEVPVREAGLVTREVAGECIIVQVRGGVADLDSIYTLNETATLVWERIDGRASTRQLASALVAEFEVEPAEAEADVTRILEELCAEGLVRLASSPEPARGPR